MWPFTYYCQECSKNHWMCCETCPHDIVVMEKQVEHRDIKIGRKIEMCVEEKSVSIVPNLSVKILHCEDSPLVQKVIARIFPKTLENHNINVSELHQLTSAEECLEHLRENPTKYDIVISDHDMLGIMKGMDMLIHIRDNSHHKMILVFSSSHDLREHGIYTLVKPVTPKHIEQFLESEEFKSYFKKNHRRRLRKYLKR